jgi:hypothetical protein
MQFSPDCNAALGECGFTTVDVRNKFCFTKWLSWCLRDDEAWAFIFRIRKRFRLRLSQLRSGSSNRIETQKLTIMQTHTAWSSSPSLLYLVNNNYNNNDSSSRCHNLFFILEELQEKFTSW